MNQKFPIQSLGCCAQSSEPFSGPAHRHMHLQAVEVALLARDVASKRSGAFFRGIEPTATDANIVAGRHRQRVHDVRLIGVALLEGLSQQFEQYPSERGFTDADAAVEAALAELALRLVWALLDVDLKHVEQREPSAGDASVSGRRKPRSDRRFCSGPPVGDSGTTATGPGRAVSRPACRNVIDSARNPDAATSFYITSTSPGMQCSAMACKPQERKRLKYAGSAI
jgi:hypothetical protein